LGTCARRRCAPSLLRTCKRFSARCLRSIPICHCDCAARAGLCSRTSNRLCRT
jgi:hypothetical protein